MSNDQAFAPTNHPVHSQSWVMFTQLSFAIALAAMAAGILLLDIDLATRGYLGMGSLLVIITSINMSKTIRDQHEADRLTNKVEDARLTDFLMKHDPLVKS